MSLPPTPAVPRASLPRPRAASLPPPAANKANTGTRGCSSTVSAGAVRQPGARFGSTADLGHLGQLGNLDNLGHPNNLGGPANGANGASTASLAGLPPELLQAIARHLGPNDYASFRACSRPVHQALSDPVALAALRRRIETQARVHLALRTRISRDVGDIDGIVDALHFLREHWSYLRSGPDAMGPALCAHVLSVVEACMRVEPGTPRQNVAPNLVLIQPCRPWRRTCRTAPPGSFPAASRPAASTCRS